MIGESGLHTLTVISSGCPDERRPNAHVAAAGHLDELPQTQAIKAVRGGINTLNRIFSFSCIFFPCMSSGIYKLVIRRS
jgi:hypothetical protein